MSSPACPRCHDPVSLPAHAPPEATVQCPLCREEFELAEVLAALPPALLVTKMPKSAMAAASDTERHEGIGFASADDDDGEEYQFAPAGDEEVRGNSAFAFDSESSPASPSASVASGSISARPRPKKKAMNPVKEIVKVAFGGIAGVLIAIILLWYLPGRYAQDILGIGPTLGKIPVVGGIVPAKFRGGDPGSKADPSLNSDDDSPFLRTEGRSPNGPQSIADYAPKNGNQNNNGNRPNNNRRASTAGPSSDEAEELDGGFAVDEPTDTFNPIADPLAAPGIELDLGNDPLSIPGIELPGESPAMPTPPGEEPGTTELPIVDPLSPPTSPNETPSVEDIAPAEIPANKPPERSAPGANALGPKNRPQVSKEEIATSVEAVKQSAVAYNSSDDLPPAEKKAVAESHYNNYAKLAKSITFLDQTDPEVTLDIQDTALLLEEVGQVPKIVTAMQYFASEDLRKPENANKGVLLIGKVTAVAASDKLFLTKVDIDSTGSTPRECTVVFPNDPQNLNAQFKEGARVVLLGTMVVNPADNLRGYQGEQPVVVWNGYFVVLEGDA